MKNKIHMTIILCFFIIILCTGCPFMSEEGDGAPSREPGNSPGRTDAPSPGTPHPSPGSPGPSPGTPQPSPGTPAPSRTPFEGPIREELEPVLEEAAQEIDINECFSPVDPVWEEQNTGYDIYMYDIEWESTEVVCEGDEMDVQFTLDFNDVTGTIYFACDCNFPCACDLLGGDARGIIAADAFIASGNITCVIDQDGILESFTISDVLVRPDNLKITTNNPVINENLESMIDTLDKFFLSCIDDLVSREFNEAISGHFELP